MFDQLPLAPQSVGDIIGRSFRLFRKNAPLFLKAQIVPAVIMTVGYIGVQASVSYGFKDIHAYSAILAGFGGMMVGFLIATVGFWLLMVKQIAFIRLATAFTRSDDDIKQSFAVAIKWADSRKWTIIALFVLFYAFIFAIFMAWGIEIGVSAVLIEKLPAMGIPGVLAGCLGAFVSALILAVYYMLAIAALASETGSWNVVISRSFSLMMGDLGRVCGFGLLMWLIVMTLSYTLTLPVLCLTMFEMFRAGIIGAEKMTALTMPLYLMVLTQLWHTAINMVLLPIVFIGYGLLYRDLRVRQEGLDVLQSVQLLTDETTAK